ncbi:Uu.00g022360.m01.CDS01 [Anthostomella pinea]|uniref:Uu.00g022360.m01.CDS01 n=1 Tax=Anthostomella pinea TaxID=933095 RepID=A0AAI8YNU9_9PEZI|nr:Uu.00g022360.m01.CDS01 [Anthostomella pinea]
MGHNKSFSTTVEDDDFEFDEAYFRQFYKPLSNLPTPPPSSRNSSAAQSPQMVAEDAESLNSQFLGPAAHLARMLPPGASFITPSTSNVENMLARANLPMDIVALAVCILDSLNSRFSRNWRVSFPLNRQGQTASKRHTLPSGPVQATHIDYVFPEIIILAALIIADKFVDDLQESTQYYGSVWGMNLWSCEQINFTERCIMESLGYRILPLWESTPIKQARHDIEMARREILQERTAIVAGNETRKHFKSMSSGHAVVGLGLQLTPAETPTSGISSPFGQLQDLGQESREAFSRSTTVPQDYLHLPY